MAMHEAFGGRSGRVSEVPDAYEDGPLEPCRRDARPSRVNRPARVSPRRERGVTPPHAPLKKILGESRGPFKKGSFGGVQRQSLWWGSKGQSPLAEVKEAEPRGSLHSLTPNTIPPQASPRGDNINIGLRTVQADRRRWRRRSLPMQQHGSCRERPSSSDRTYRPCRRRRNRPWA